MRTYFFVGRENSGEYKGAKMAGNPNVDASCFQIIDIADFQLKILIHF